MRLVLASSSPRRHELLERLGLDFEIVIPDADETRLPDEPPGVFVERLARDKVVSVAAQGLLVIGADTAVVRDGQVLGKPAHPSEATAMLNRLQGASHDVFTGVAVSLDGQTPVSAVDVTEVTMVPMTADEIDDYVKTGEPMDKAGAYALQGAGGRFVEGVGGSPFTVVGLPIHLLPKLAFASGANLDSFRKPPPTG